MGTKNWGGKAECSPLGDRYETALQVTLSGINSVSLSPCHMSGCFLHTGDRQTSISSGRNCQDCSGVNTSAASGLKGVNK